MSVIKQALRRKPASQVQAEHGRADLKRSLNAINLIFLGVGCVIGAGIFVLTGRAAAQYAGPAIILSFVLTGVLCGFVALCYSELASALPVSGSAYSYAYVAVGEGAAWVMGLLLLLEYGLAASTVAVSWSGYFVSLLGDLHLALPVLLTRAPAASWHDPGGTLRAGGLVNLPAVLILFALTLLLVRGVTESTRVNNIIVLVKLAVVLAFIFVGARYVRPGLWSPFIPPQAPPPPAGTPPGLLSEIGRALVAVATGDNSVRYGVGGIIRGAAVIFFAYQGFEAVSTAAAETRKPARDLPIGILATLAICTVLYIATAAVLVGIVPYAALDDPAPIALAVNRIGLSWFAVIVKVGALAGLTSVILVLLYGQSRVLYAMSRDGLLPAALGRVHPVWRTPWVNTVITGAFTATAAGLLSLDTLGDLTNVGSLTAFAMVCLTVICLRTTDPQLQRPFRTPFYPVTPILGASMCALLLMSLMARPTTRGFFIIYLAVGAAVYFLRSHRLSDRTVGS